MAPLALEHQTEAISCLARDVGNIRLPNVNLGEFYNTVSRSSRKEEMILAIIILGTSSVSRSIFIFPNLTQVAVAVPLFSGY
jgi:hypothetical protein